MDSIASLLHPAMCEKFQQSIKILTFTQITRSGEKFKRRSIRHHIWLMVVQTPRQYFRQFGCNERCQKIDTYDRWRAKVNHWWEYRRPTTPNIEQHDEALWQYGWRFLAWQILPLMPVSNRTLPTVNVIWQARTIEMARWMLSAFELTDPVFDKNFFMAHRRD